MKLISSSGWMSWLFSGDQRATKLRMLEQQRTLLQTGIDATAEVMNTTLLEDKVSKLFTVKLWLKLRKADGSFIYTNSLTLISINNIPYKGQILRIKYFPENLSQILIL